MESTPGGPAPKAIGHGLWQRVPPLYSGALLLVVALLPAPARAIPPDAVQRAIGATVFIKVERTFRNQALPTFGSGFFIDKNGHILTNWHVVAPQLQLRLDGRDSEVSTTVNAVNVVVNSGAGGEQTLVARVLRLDRSRDLALIKVPFTPSAWLDVSAPPEVALTDAVVAVGYPFGDLLALNKRNPEVTVTRGHTTSIRHDEKGGVEAFQLDAAVNPGNSGGPVLNEAGSVVGVAWAGVTGATGTALAIAPGRVRAFSDSIQFSVSIDPPAIYTRSQPLVIEVGSLLRETTGLQGRVTLTGPDIDETGVELVARGPKLTCSLGVPEVSKAAGTVKSYTLTMHLIDSGGRKVHRQAWSLPLREGQAAQLQTERPAASVLRDRRDYRNEGSSGEIWMPPGAGEQGAQGSGKTPLSQLASAVKLRRSPDSDQGLVVTNSNLNSVGFVVNDAWYAALPDGVRSVAIEFDRAEFRLRGASAGVSYGSGFFDNAPSTESSSGSGRSRGSRAAQASNERARVADAKASSESYRTGVAQDASSARTSLEAARGKVLDAKLCRCPDHTWFRIGDKASCERCVSP